jgi:hypothetical protein
LFVEKYRLSSVEEQGPRNSLQNKICHPLVREGRVLREKRRAEADAELLHLAFFRPCLVPKIFAKHVL